MLILWLARRRRAALSCGPESLRPHVDHHRETAAAWPAVDVHGMGVE